MSETPFPRFRFRALTGEERASNPPSLVLVSKNSLVLTRVGPRPACMEVQYADGGPWYRIPIIFPEESST